MGKGTHMMPDGKMMHGKSMKAAMVKSMPKGKMQKKMLKHSGG